LHSSAHYLLFCKLNAPSINNIREQSKNKKQIT